MQTILRILRNLVTKLLATWNLSTLNYAVSLQKWVLFHIFSRTKCSSLMTKISNQLKSPLPLHKPSLVTLLEMRNFLMSIDAVMAVDRLPGPILFYNVDRFKWRRPSTKKINCCVHDSLNTYSKFDPVHQIYLEIYGIIFRSQTPRHFFWAFPTWNSLNSCPNTVVCC